MEFYSKLQPALDKVSQGHRVGCPSCYYASEEAGVIIMDNLRLEGFSIMEKADGLDMPHLKVVLELLAKLHAASYHYIQNYYGGLQRFLKVRT